MIGRVNRLLGASGRWSGSAKRVALVTQSCEEQRGSLKCIDGANVTMSGSSDDHVGLT